MATEAALKRKWEIYHETFHIRFWDRVAKRAPDECWPYTGSTRANGYGRLRLHGKYELAHRLAYRFSVGEIKDDLNVCHTCDNPPCCNPNHLFLGTDVDNARDKVAKGRATGAPRILDYGKVAALRAGGSSYSKIASHFGVNQSSVAKALKRIALKARP